MSAGYIRRLDDLSRVVIPKDFRNIYGWKANDELELCPTKEGLFVKKRANTNADRIRAMTNEELAEFFATKLPCEACDFPDIMLQWLLESCSGEQTADENKANPSLVIEMLDRMKEENGEQVIIIETPNGTASLKLRDAMIYEGCGGEIVLDSE